MVRRTVEQLHAMHLCPDTAFGSGDESTEDHNRQVAKIMNALGETGVGRRAILRAFALRQGIDDEEEIEDILHGRSDRKVDAPPGLREALGDSGLGPILAPVNVLMARERERERERANSCSYEWAMGGP